MPLDRELVQRCREIQRRTEDAGVSMDMTPEYLARACENEAVLRFIEALLDELDNLAEVIRGEDN